MKGNRFGNICKMLAVLVMAAVALSGCIANLSGVQVHLAEDNYQLLPGERIYVRHNDQTVVEAVYSGPISGSSTVYYVYEAITDYSKKVVGGYVTDGERSWTPAYGTGNVSVNVNRARFDSWMTSSDWGKPDRAAAAVEVNGIRSDGSHYTVSVSVLDANGAVISQGRPEVFMASGSDQLTFFESPLGASTLGGYSQGAVNGEAEFIVADSSADGALDVRRHDVSFYSGPQLLTVNYADSYLVAMDKQNLEIGYADGDNAAAVTQPLTLPTTGEDGSSISWSSDSDLIGNDGALQPITLLHDDLVVLTATITKGTEATTKEFNVQVLGGIAHIVGVDQTPNLRVAHGTQADNISLPDTIGVRLNDGSSAELDVSWDLVGSGYNGNVARAYTVEGTLQLPANMRNSQKLQISATITVAKRSSSSAPSGKDCGATGCSFELGGGTLIQSDPLNHNYNLDVREQTAPEQGRPAGGELIGQSFSFAVAQHGSSMPGVSIQASLPEHLDAGQWQARLMMFNVDEQLWEEVEGEDGVYSVVPEEGQLFAIFAVPVLDEQEEGGQTESEPAESEPATSAEPSGKGSAFNDVAGNWAAGLIEQAVNRGIIAGFGDGSFRPEQQVSRAEFVAMLARALRLETGGGDSGLTIFADYSAIPGWARAAVAAAYEAGVISGFEDGAFRGELGVSRAEIAVMIARALQLSGGSGTDEAVRLSALQDGELIPAWASSAVAAMLEHGLMTGVSATQFAPERTLNRAEAAVLMLRLAEKQ